MGVANAVPAPLPKLSVVENKLASVVRRAVPFVNVARVALSDHPATVVTVAKLKAAAIAPNVNATPAQLPNRAAPTNPAAAVVTAAKLKVIAVAPIVNAVLVALPEISPLEKSLQVR